MDIVTDRGSVHLSFGYTTDKKHRTVTHAYVTLFDGVEVLEGVATCSKLDRFSKEVGRKTALSYAIQGLPRELRAQIWTGYFSRLNTGK
jgi:hypothetical protein